MKAFLGGTCAGQHDWRDEIIPHITIDYFNPVIKDREWTMLDRENEEVEKKLCKVHVYTITSDIQGVYSIAEAAIDTMLKERICILCLPDLEKQSQKMKKSLEATAKLLAHHG